MSEITDLTIPQSDTSLVQANIDSEFNEMTQGTDFLPRVQLMAAQSSLVQDGKAQLNEYALITGKDTVIGLGKSFDALVIALRMKAMRISGEEVLSYFNIQNPEFIKIKEEVASAQSGDMNGCLCGPEFIIWIPEQKVFATLFMASKSQRRTAPMLRSFIDTENNRPGPVTFNVKIAESKRFKSKWPVPDFSSCSVPFDMPDANDYSTVVGDFLNPKDSDVETAEVADADSGRDR